jgi:hypothetical protein
MRAERICLRLVIASAFSACSSAGLPRTIGVAPGDRVRISRGDTQVVGAYQSSDEDGLIIVSNDTTISIAP